MRVILSILVSFYASFLFSQELTIKGYIHDESGEAIPGVHVIEGYSLRATSSNSEGYFNIRFSKSENMAIRFSHIAFEELILDEYEIRKHLESKQRFLEVTLVLKTNVLGTFDFVYNEVDTFFW
jgi:hypothetical protein